MKLVARDRGAEASGGGMEYTWASMVSSARVNHSVKHLGVLRMGSTTCNASVVLTRRPRVEEGGFEFCGAVCRGILAFSVWAQDEEVRYELNVQVAYVAQLYAASESDWLTALVATP